MTFTREEIIGALKDFIEGMDLDETVAVPVLFLKDVYRLLTIDEMPTVGGWISVKDRLPEAGKHVLADCEVRLISGRKKHYVCKAYYAPTHTISVGSFPDDAECYEYDEEDDNYYLLEGWYECIHNWDDYSGVVIGDFVTHWMLLPEPPKEVSEDG